jgi:hypothetical protein
VAGNAAEVGAEPTLGTAERDGSHPQDAGDAVGPGALATSLGELLAARDSSPRTQLQQRHEVVLGREAGEVRPHLIEDRRRGFGADTVDAGEVDAGDPSQRVAPGRLPATLHLLLLRLVRMGRHGGVVIRWRLQLAELVIELLVVGRDLGVEHVIEAERRAQVEEVFFAPGSREVLGDFSRPARREPRARAPKSG